MFRSAKSAFRKCLSSAFGLGGEEFVSLPGMRWVLHAGTSVQGDSRSKGRHGGKESDSSLYTEGLDSPWRMEQLKDGKPPQHLSIIRHCASTDRLEDSLE
ncbi:hypothetical protein KSP39_PZI022241 [Platanthera zijinensis]|uniref:Uncharacterized protein n=1 Tax=Platanthera zijinensis TaxID=2320716 RepID=A0AAP0FU47_9ASPA